MIGGILTLIFGILSVVMFTQPVIGIYGQNSEGGLESYDLDGSLFDFINFEGSTYQTVASVFMIIALVFAGLTLLITIFNLFSRAASKKAKIGAKVTALAFFLAMLVAVVMVALFCINDLFMSKEGWDFFRELGAYVTVGWGMLVSFGCSLLCLIFAPRKKL